MEARYQLRHSPLAAICDLKTIAESTCARPTIGPISGVRKATLPDPQSGRKTDAYSSGTPRASVGNDRGLHKMMMPSMNPHSAPIPNVNNVTMICKIPMPT